MIKIIYIARTGARNRESIAHGLNVRLMMKNLLALQMESRSLRHF